MLGRRLTWLDDASPFPAVTRALRRPNGLLAASESITAARLVDAYRHGIFPWYSEGEPVLWWSPDPRMVLKVADFAPSQRLMRTVRQGKFVVRMDTAFEAVMRACANVSREGQDGTWITDDIVQAYSALHKLGLAHSVECWQDGQLVGGLYGVHIGRMFYGESMFTRVTDASKVALVHLVAMLRKADMPLIDCQQETAHLASFGAAPISRTVFVEAVAKLVNEPQPYLALTSWTRIP